MLSDNLLRLRKEKGYSRETLAKLAGVHANTIRYIEKGKTPLVYTLECIAKSLNVTVNDLIK